MNAEVLEPIDGMTHYSVPARTDLTRVYFEGSQRPRWIGGGCSPSSGRYYGVWKHCTQVGFDLFADRDAALQDQRLWFDGYFGSGRKYGRDKSVFVLDVA